MLLERLIQSSSILHLINNKQQYIKKFKFYKKSYQRNDVYDAFQFQLAVRRALTLSYSYVKHTETCLHKTKAGSAGHVRLPVRHPKLRRAVSSTHQNYTAN